MSLTTLVLSLGILFLLFLYRKKITIFLNEKFDTNIQTEWIVYIVTILLVIVTMLGMLMDSTSASWGKTFDDMKTSDGERPHRYFDINTYDD